MFKKFSAIVAALAITFTGLTATAANASVTANAGSNQYNSWNLSANSGGNVSTSTASSVLPENVEDYSLYLNFRFGQDLAKSLAGHDIRVVWNESFPGNMHWFVPYLGMTNTLNKYETLRGNYGFNIDYNAPNFRDPASSTEGPTGSRIFSIPSNVSGLTGSESIDLTLGISTYNGAQAGTYTIAPTLYDLTTQALIPLSTTETTNDMWMTYWSSINGSGEYTGTVPAGGTFRQEIQTCVARSSFVQGDSLLLSPIQSGAFISNNNWVQIWKKGSSNQQAGSFNNGTYVVQAADMASDANGFRISTGIDYTNNTNLAATPPATALSIRNNTQGSAQIETSCAPATPGTPTFSLTSRTSATISWQKSADDPVSNNQMRYTYKLFKASDLNTVLASEEFYNPTLDGNIYSVNNVLFRDSSWNALPVDLDTDYVVTITAHSFSDYASSAPTAVSNTQSLATPAPLAAPTFTLSKVNGMFNAAFEWTKATSDVATQWGRSVGYEYAIYAASAPTVVVASGNINMNGLTPSGTGRYSKTVTELYANGMCCQTVNFTANTNYFAKFTYYDFNLDLESAPSAASANSMIVGPSAPPAPTITTINAGFITATFTAPAGKTGAEGYSYRAFAYQVNDITPPVALANSSCMSTTPSGTAFTCNLGSVMGAFTAPNSYYVRLVASLNGIESLQSVASPARVGGWPGVDVSAPSEGVLNGDAKMYAPAVPGVMTTFGSRGTILTDARGGYYSLMLTADPNYPNGNPTSATYDFRKLKSDYTGWDSTFGSSGKQSLSIATNIYQGNVNQPNMPGLSFFDGSAKVAAITGVQNCSAPGMNYSCATPSMTTWLSEATVGSAFSTPINVSQKLLDFCSANVDSDITNVYNATVSAYSGFTGFSRPVALVSCNGSDGNTMSYTQQFLASFAVDGTLTHMVTMNDISNTENLLISSQVSANPNATGSDIAAVILAVRGYSSNGRSSSALSSSYTRKFIRVAADGTATQSSTSAYTFVGTEPSVRLAPVNDGTTVYATNILSSMGVTTAKIMTAPVASGDFTIGNAMTLDVPVSNSLNLSFPYNSVPNVAVAGEGEKLAFVRTDGGNKIAPMSYRVSNGAVVTGEQLTNSVSGSTLSYGFIAPNGNMYYMYSPAAQAVTHKVIRWNNVRTMVPVPTPMVTMPSSMVSLNTGGANFTINGLNFAETSAAKKVTGVRFVGTGITPVNVTTMTKSATAITVKIPAATATGFFGTAPSALAPGSAQVMLVLGNGSSVMAGSVTYVGTTKLVQPLTLTVSVGAALTTDADRTATISGGTVSQNQMINDAIMMMPPVIPVLSSTTATICTIVDNKVHFVSNGNCIVKASKAGNDWLAEGIDTKTIAVLKGDVATITFNEGESAAEGASEDDAIIPNITLASGRSDYTMTSADTSLCSVNADTKAVWFKAGNQHCLITIATTGTVNGWAAYSYVWDVTMGAPVGDSAAGAILVRNDNKLTNLPGLGVTWDQKTNKVYFTTKVRRVGPVQVKMTFTGVDQVDYTCTSNFGILKKTALPAVGPLLITSGALCTDTKNGNNAAMSVAEKAAQTLAYTKFKELSTAIQSGNGTNYIPVKFEYRRELRSAYNYTLVNPQAPGYGAWSTPRYAKLNYRAIDKISAALPTGVVAAVSATADGAVNPVITLESKRTDYTVVSSDTDKCAVLADGRIWFKTADVNCVLTIGTGTNTIWAGKSYTWSIPMVAAVGVDAATAPIAPSNGTAVNSGPLSMVWTQATNSVVLKYNNVNPGMVLAKMTFTGVDNNAYTCVVKFGSAAKVAATAVPTLKTQTGPAFCTYVTGLTAPEKAAQATSYAAFKTLVAAKKTASQPIVATIAYQFEAHSPLTGALLDGQVLNGPYKPFSANFLVKLNWRATAN